MSYSDTHSDPLTEHTVLYTCMYMYNFNAQCHVQYHYSTLLLQRNSFKYLIVIHYCIEGLDPHWVNVSIQHNPLGVIIGEVGHVPHDGGEQAILPLTRGWIDEAKEFVCGNGLGIDVLPDRL